MALLANVAPFFIFSAFVLLLLVTLSAPIIHSIYLFSVLANVGSDVAGAAARVNFGVFGYCTSPVKYSILGASSNSGAGECSSPHLGYTFDPTVASALGVSSTAKVISRATAAVFILNPIAAGLAFLACLTSLFMICKGRNGTSRFSSFLTFGIGGLASFLATVAFVANIVIVAILRKRVRDQSDGALTLTYGNGIWMTLAAMVALWLGVTGAFCGICACGGRNRRSKHAATH